MKPSQTGHMTTSAQRNLSSRSLSTKLSLGFRSFKCITWCI